MNELERHRERPEEAGDEVREAGPVIVVTAMDLSVEARQALAERLGPGHVVRDIREAGDTADLVLIPAVSTRLIGGLRRLFPGARILVTEFTDPRFDADFAGPVARTAEAGVDGYFVVPSLDELASITYQAARGRPAAGLLGSGPSPRAALGDATGPADLDRGGTGSILIDVDQWPADDTFRRFARMIIDQLRDQGIEVIIRATDPDGWSGRG
ncbi:hypothetical protein [Microlunatus speluncae]|uniref:hypothetical protein n=1 Tax=Microlunatus speluncae TaxID=2594267 RepID=UPI001375595B|nr:hypothetical protein [Microlunatus speluncae]